jgi:hypothetical protein
VLNVSDRHDGAEIEAAEEIAAGEVADKLALVLTRLGARSATWLEEGGEAVPAPQPTEPLGPTFDQALAAAGQAVARATGKQEPVDLADAWSDDDLEQFADEVELSARSRDPDPDPDPT